MSTSGGYHVHVGSKLIKVFQFLLKTLMYWTSPDYSWYPTGVLMIYPMYSWYTRCTHDIPDVLMISPRCTHVIPPHASWYPPDVFMISPDVLMVSPQCTEHPPIDRCTHDIPPMYWAPPDVLMMSPWGRPPPTSPPPPPPPVVLNTHDTGWICYQRKDLEDFSVS